MIKIALTIMILAIATALFFLGIKWVAEKL